MSADLSGEERIAKIQEHAVERAVERIGQDRRLNKYQAMREERCNVPTRELDIVLSELASLRSALATAQAETERAWKRSEEGYRAHSASFGALVQISLLTSLDGEVDDYADVTRAVEAELTRLRSALAEATEARTKLDDAVRWALGENGEFRVRDARLTRRSGVIAPNEGPYYWRSELRKRAFGAPASLSVAPTDEDAPYDVSGLEPEPGLEMSFEEAAALGKKLQAAAEDATADVSASTESEDSRLLDWLQALMDRGEKTADVTLWRDWDVAEGTPPLYALDQSHWSEHVAGEDLRALLRKAMREVEVPGFSASTEEESSG